MTIDLTVRAESRWGKKKKGSRNDDCVNISITEDTLTISQYYYGYDSIRIPLHHASELLHDLHKALMGFENAKEKLEKY